MSIFLKFYLLAFIVFFAVDMIWLGLIAKSFYADALKGLMRSSINWGAAILFYLLFIAALVFFVLLPGLEKDSLGYVMLAGALFGFITYATYDLTNWATLEGWPVKLVVVDITWGTFLGFSTSVLSFLLYRLFF